MATKKLPNFIKKQPIALSCGLLCVGLVVAIYFRHSVLAEATDSFAERKSVVEHLRENLANAHELDDQSTAMTQAVQAIEARLVHADQLAINLQYFYKIESETQAKLTDLRQTGAATTNARNSEKTAYTGIGYSISVQGSYPQLLDFLRRVEGGERFARMQGLTLTGAGDSSEETPGKPTNLSLILTLQLLGLP
jgi:hypothetical protein